MIEYRAVLQGNGEVRVDGKMDGKGDVLVDEANALYQIILENFFACDDTGEMAKDFLEGNNEVLKRVYKEYCEKADKAQKAQERS